MATRPYEYVRDKAGKWHVVRHGSVFLIVDNRRTRCK